MKRISGLLLILILTITSCQKSEESVSFEDTGDGKLVVWSWIQSSDEKYLEPYKAVNPDFDYEFVYVERKDYLTKLSTSLSAGLDMPDIIFMDVSERATIFDMDIVENLDQAPYNFDRSLVLDWTIGQNTDSNGAVRAVNWDIAPGGLVVNKKLALDSLGTDSETELEELLSDWEKVSKLQLDGEAGLFDSLEEVTSLVFQQNIGDLHDGDVLDLTTMYSKTYSAAISLHNNGSLINGNRFFDANYMGSFAAQSKIASYGPIWMVPIIPMLATDADVNNDNWVVINAPGGGYIDGGTSMGIYSGSDDKLTAWKYIQWLLLSEEGASLNKEVEQRFISFKSMYDKPSFTELTHPYFGEQNIGMKYAEIAKDLPELKLSVYMPKLKALRTEINVKIETGEIKTADAAVDYALTEFASAYPEVKIK